MQQRKIKTVWTLNGEPMPVVTESMHVGVLRSASTQITAVAENIKKARQTLYSLMPSGCQGPNGLDPETSIHLLQTYVLPTLIYGMEVVRKTSRYTREVLQKYLKLLLSILVATADPAVYVLSGTVPIDATIHKRALTQGLFWPKIFVREKIPFGQKQWEIFKFSEIFFSLARTNWVRFFFFFFFFCKGQILYQNCMYKYYYCLFCNVL